MKYKIFLLFIITMIMVPITANAEVYYFNYSDYYYSSVEIEECDEIEVKPIFSDSGIIYQYRTREYIRLPDEIFIYYDYFNINSVLDTNISLENIAINEYYDLYTMNHCDSLVEIIYGDITIQKPVHISIESYIHIPEEIVVTSYDFNIWDYIDTNIVDKEDVKFIGDYDLFTNGQYELQVTYYGIDANTQIIVDIEDNNKHSEVVNNVKTDKEMEEIDNTAPKINVLPVKIIVPSVKMIDSSSDRKNNQEAAGLIGAENNCTNLRPINRLQEKHTTQDNSKDFYYISYGFYALIIILLSIIVVRKK